MNTGSGPVTNDRSNALNTEHHTHQQRERERELLFKRETENLCLRQLMHGIGRDPFARA